MLRSTTKKKSPQQRDGSLAAPHRRSYLGNLELMVLLAVSSLGKQAYGTKIAARVASSGLPVHSSAVYTTLGRLAAKKMVTSVMGAPTATRGGRAKRYFSLSASGEKAMRASANGMRKLLSSAK